MGFLEVISRLLRGQPAFVESKYEQSQERKDIPGQRYSPAGDANKLVDEGGNKIIPELEVSHLKSHSDGSTMMTTAWIANPSTHRVRIDDIILVKQKTVCHRELGPGEGHEVTLYHGPTPQNDHEHKGQIIYRLMENGDRFRADYMVEYDRQADGTYMIETLHPDHPVHDI